MWETSVPNNMAMTSFDTIASFKCLQGFSGHQLHDQYVFPLSDFYTQPSCVLQQVWCLHSDRRLMWAEELAITHSWSSVQRQPPPPAWTHLFPSTTDKILLHLPETRYVVFHCCIINVFNGILRFVYIEVSLCLQQRKRDFGGSVLSRKDTEIWLMNFSFQAS